MRYLGGKSVISGKISKIINDKIEEVNNPNSVFISLFCGACSIESKIKSQFHFCNDKHPYLIAMYKALQNGYEFPEFVSEEQYKYIREHKDENPALTGFVGFGCSFGGKWFGGYARTHEEPKGFAGEAKRSLIKINNSLNKAVFTCLDYKDVDIPDGSFVYADPPYMNTTKYSKGMVIDYEEFWDYMRKISKNNYVFISEQTAPDDFVSIWEKESTRFINTNGRFKVTEHLFVYKYGKYLE
jgi:DNA adenine methylase